MRIEGFQNIVKTDNWIFFAFSADYSSGEASMYMKSYDGFTVPMSKTVSIVFSEF